MESEATERRIKYINDHTRDTSYKMDELNENVKKLIEEQKETNRLLGYLVRNKYQEKYGRD